MRLVCQVLYTRAAVEFQASSSCETIASDVSLAGEFDAEREELLQKLDACAPQQADFIRLQWEQTQRISEVTELQKVQDLLPCTINCSAKVANLGALLRI